jgi:hypothetical protein
MLTVVGISNAMTTWVGVFVSKVDGKTIREIEVEADDEETAVVMLDFYEFDESWQNYSFVEIRKKKWDWLAALFGILKKIRLTKILHPSQ